MSYCQRCGQKLSPQSSFCKNCNPTSSKSRESMLPDSGYDIHTAKCRHKLKLDTMAPGEKLDLLGSKKVLFIGNLLLILTVAALLLTDLFRTDNPLLTGVMEIRTGLFGPRGGFFTGLYFLAFLVSFFIAGNPLYSRNTYDPIQLLPAMILEVLLLPILCFTIWLDFYFGDYMGTALDTGGILLLLFSIGGLLLQFLLIRQYKKLRKSGVYSYVAN